MTRQALESLKPLKAEIESIKAQIQDLEVITDSVTGSLPEHPWTEQHYKIKGVDQRQYTRLIAKLRITMGELCEKVQALEAWLEEVADPEMRAILRMRYVEGLSWQGISDKMGSRGDGSTERKKCNKFLEKIELS